MYISILYNIINCHARVFYEKKQTNLDLLSIPRLWGEKTNTEYTGSLGYNSVFRVCYITSIDVDVILDTCSTIEIIICLKKNQSTPRPSEHPPVMGEKMSKRYHK